MKRHRHAKIVATLGPASSSEAVAMMDRIIGEVEADPYARKALDDAHPAPRATVEDAICCALRRSAAILDVTAAITYTSSGATSLRAARERPAAPIISLGSNQAVARKLALVWGVHSLQVGEVANIDDVVDRARNAAREEGFAQNGDVVAITAGTPFGVSGTTNFIKLAVV